MNLNKRQSIALAFWYERQPHGRAAIWNTKHRQQPSWLLRQFAGYVSWKYMGGPSTWWNRLVTSIFFYLTCALYAWHCRKQPKQ